MKKTLEVTHESAVKAHNEASNKGKTLLENLFGKKVFQTDVKDRIHSLEDVIAELGEDDPDVLEYQKLLKAGVSDYILACQELVMIAKAYNEKEEPDYNNSNQRKYEPNFKLSSSGVGFSYLVCDHWITASVVGSRLVFLNYDNMKDAVSKFLPVYKRWHIK